jgi:hypothetical protein
VSVQGQHLADFYLSVNHYRVLLDFTHSDDSRYLTDREKSHHSTGKPESADIGDHDTAKGICGNLQERKR